MRDVRKSHGPAAPAGLLLAAPGARRRCRCSAAVRRATWSRTRRGCPRSGTRRPARTSCGRPTLGSQSYGGPVVADGKVFVGTNNEGAAQPEAHRRPRRADGLRRQGRQVPLAGGPHKLPAGRVNDWPLQGICSSPAVEGDRVYYVSNRAEVIAADTEGFLDKENDGPFQTETEKSDIDEDVIWKLDMIGELDVFPHNLAAGNPLIVGDMLYIVTGNGVDEGHINIPSPQAPSFIALDKKTGKLLWESDAAGREDPARAVVEPGLRRDQGQAAGDLPGRRRLALLVRARDRQADLEVRLQPEGLRLQDRRRRHPQRHHRHAGGLRRQGLHRRRPGPGARRGDRPPVGDRRHAWRAT